MPDPKLDSGDTAWLLVSTALVLLMTPGLALFYGGMVRKKNVLSTFMHSLFSLAVVSVQWVLFGYSLAFGATHKGLIGGLELSFLKGVAWQQKGSVPHLGFMAFQMMFAGITPALISGAFAERIRFGAYALFVVLWSTLVYDPVAHWVWAEGGWLMKMGALDFAGGTVVHLTAGISALVCAKLIGKRLGYPGPGMIPHNLTMTLTGAGLLWFGWFGFNAGSALVAGQSAALALVTTHVAASAGALGWLAVETKHRGKPSALGAASGIVAGLVAITPGAGYVAPWASIVIGFVAGVVCYLAVLQKNRFGYDDALDVFGVHGVGGMLGALLTGVFAQKALNATGNDGAAFGNVKQLGVQALGLLAAGAYAVVMTVVIWKVIGWITPIRVAEPDEREGLDVSLHGEEGYVN
ncbi:MAG: ammonium transporter [Myxococcales bacterium]|nr:ammonium transporter [Myxococcales bacterium]